MKPFELIPFTPDSAPQVRVTGNIERRHNQLNITYNFTDSRAIVIPRPATPSRLFDLWEHTCCEFFLGVANSTQYWEFNLSPAGHWNVFRFPDYRQNISEEMVFEHLPFQVGTWETGLQLNLKLDLGKIIAPEQSLALGITAVIEDQAGQLSYWALSHPGKEADFHLRDSFIIEL
ncbi:MAG: DOMON-like domain-containing protein [Cyanobacteria bacterium P01_C01_bin.72]